MSNDPFAIPPTVTFRGPGDLIAAVPAMLGFVPSRSLVLMAFDAGGSRISVTMRHDLELDRDGVTTATMDHMISHLCDVCLRDNTSGVFAIAVDDRFDLEHECWDLLFSDIDDGLADVGLGGGFVISDMAPGQRWRTRWGTSARRGDGGVLADPRFSPMAVAHAVTTGRVVLPSRDVMATGFTPGPHCDDAGCDGRSVIGTAAEVPDDAELLRRVLDAVVDGIDARTPCAQVAILEAAITRFPVRDALLALAVSEVAGGAEVLWEELTRRLRGTGRAAAATLLGHLHYMRGNGAMAGLALDCALDTRPGYSLATLLDRSLRAGMRPSTLEELLPTSRRTAADLGVTLPAHERDAS